MLHRRLREGAWSPRDARTLTLRFSEHSEADLVLGDEKHRYEDSLVFGGNSAGFVDDKVQNRALSAFQF